RDRPVLRHNGPLAVLRQASRAARRKHRPLRRLVRVRVGPARPSAVQAAVGKPRRDRHVERRASLARPRRQRPASRDQRSRPPAGRGWRPRGFALVRSTLPLVAQRGNQTGDRPAPASPNRRVWDLNTLEPKLYAYDKASGQLVAEVPIPANAGGAPMTYMVGG